MSGAFPRRRWFVIYAAIAVIAGIVVGQLNERISATLGASSPAAALSLIVLLPLLAIATRPVYVRAAQRDESRRVIGVIWAFRSGKGSFFAKTVVVWIAVFAIIGGLVIALYRQGGAVAVATIANWLVVASALVFLTHIAPADATRLRLAERVSIFVLGPEGAGKTTFIALAPLDHLSKESATWSVQPGTTAANVAVDLYEKRGQTLPQGVGSLEHIVIRRQVWSEFTGVRPRPVEFTEVPDGAAPGAWKAKSGNSGFAVVLRRELDPKLLREQLSRIRQIAAARSKMKIPVALVLTGLDSDAERSALPGISEETKKLLDEFTRKWRVFLTTDRAGGDAEDFTPAGQVSAIAWLLRKM
jgi:hypothetical protein